MRNENINTVNCCGKEIKKETLVLSAFYSMAFITSILIPNVIAVFIEGKMIKSFCEFNENNQNICAQYERGEYGLLEDINFDYGLVALFSVFVGMIATTVMLLAKHKLDHCKKEQSDSSEASSLVSNHQSDDRCRLFKACRDNVLPTKFEVAQLIIIGIALIGGAALSGLCTSLIVWDRFYPIPEGLSPSDNQILSDFTDSLFKTMMISVVAIGAISSLVISVASMIIASCVKYRMNSEVNDRLLINDDDDQSYGSGGQHRFEL